jgi:hypothetical protein
MIPALTVRITHVHNQFLKDIMKSAVFNMKESVKKIDIDVESAMMSAEHRTGPPGPRVSFSFSVYVYTSVCVCVCVCV